MIKPLLSPGQALTLRDTLEQPSWHQSPSVLPQRHLLQAGARTVTLEARTVFVTITYPPLWTIPHPDPLPDQEASSSTTFSRKRYSPGLAPDLQPGHPGPPGSIWSLGG